jgi:hypothetical protein
MMAGVPTNMSDQSSFIGQSQLEEINRLFHQTMTTGRDKRLTGAIVGMFMFRKLVQGKTATYTPTIHHQHAFQIACRSRRE